MNENAERETLIEFPDLDALTRYAKAALDWDYVTEDGDRYYQRMFNLAGDVVKLADALRELEPILVAARSVAETHHGGIRVTSNGRQAVPLYKLKRLRELLGMPV